MKLLKVAQVSEDNPDKPSCKLDAIFEEVAKKDPRAWCYGQYRLMKNAAGKTQKSIIISLAAEFCNFMTPAIAELTSFDTVNIGTLGDEKIALYVKCSDTDRSKDKLVSLFFTQLFQELFQKADKSPEHALKRPVHIILDDMGSNLKIPNLDCAIACSRGRNISMSIILQSVGQLKKNYKDYTSILNSCNNIVFLGGNDIETCNEMSLRLNRPLEEVLYKPSRVSYVFKQGDPKPHITEIYNLKEHRCYSMLNDNWKSDDEICK
jgi:type IV secretion system protein VirD4